MFWRGEASASNAGNASISLRMRMAENTILGISGSIRPGASSTQVLEWIGAQFSAADRFRLFTRLRDIPPFDGADVLPEPVENLTEEVNLARLVVISSPEYAHGMPGVLKNALDWMVAENVWTGKPVVIVTAAGQGVHAHASLTEVLRTMSADVLHDESVIIPFVKSKLDADGRITDAATRQVLQRIVQWADDHR